MKTRIVDGSVVRLMMPMARGIDLMAGALGSLQRGRSLDPLRSFTLFDSLGLGVEDVAAAAWVLAAARRENAGLEVALS